MIVVKCTELFLEQDFQKYQTGCHSYPSNTLISIHLCFAVAVFLFSLFLKAYECTCVQAFSG